MMETASFRITEEAYQQMVASLKKESPREACGFLAGRHGIADRFYPLDNLNGQLKDFFLDAGHVRRTEISIHRRNQQIMALCHSHPTGVCHPDPWDIQARFLDPDLGWPAWLDGYYLIARFPEESDAEVRCYRLVIGVSVDEIPLVREPLQGCGSSRAVK